MKSQHTLLAGLVFASMLSQPTHAAEFQFDYQAYLGAVGVVGDAVDCDSSACQGVLASTPFYGLSLRGGYGPVSAQVIGSQDEDGKPELALGQLGLGWQLGPVRTDFRAGKIINPLGLYGANRIKPTARPGALLPQSFLLNSYYDSLTSTDIGAGLNVAVGDWIAKLAVFEPQDEQFETSVGGGGGMLGGLLGILPIVVDDPMAMAPMTVTETRSTTSYYAGGGFDNFVNRVDVGFVQIRFEQNRIDAWNVGYERRIAQWLLSAEYLYTRTSGEAARSNRGLSLTTKYHGDGWEAFANWVRFDRSDVEPEDYNVGFGVYRGPLSFIFALHRLRGTGLGDGDDVTTGAISIGYRVK